MVPLSDTFSFVLVESFSITMTFTINISQILTFHPEAQLICFPLKHSFQVMRAGVSLRKPSVISQLICLLIGHQNEELWEIPDDWPGHSGDITRWSHHMKMAFWCPGAIIKAQQQPRLHWGERWHFSHSSTCPSSTSVPCSLTLPLASTMPTPPAPGLSTTLYTPP